MPRTSWVSSGRGAEALRTASAAEDGTLLSGLLSTVAGAIASNTYSRNLYLEKRLALRIGTMLGIKAVLNETSSGAQVTSFEDPMAPNTRLRYLRGASVIKVKMILLTLIPSCLSWWLCANAVYRSFTHFSFCLSFPEGYFQNNDELTAIITSPEYFSISWRLWKSVLVPMIRYLIMALRNRDLGAPNQSVSPRVGLLVPEASVRACTTIDLQPHDGDIMSKLQST